MRAMLLCLLAFATVLLGFPQRWVEAEHCPCAEEHETEQDCCLPGPEQCGCETALLGAIPQLTALASRPAPIELAAAPAGSPRALHTLPRPPPPLPPPIG